jgi:hypothetical protein
LKNSSKKYKKILPPPPYQPEEVLSPPEEVPGKFQGVPISSRERSRFAIQTGKIRDEVFRV